MRCPALWLILLLATAPIARADDAAFKVGITTRELAPPAPYDWRGARQRTLHATIWYPAATTAREDTQWIGPPLLPLLRAGRAAPDAPPAAGPRRPLVVLSHGFGGAASDLAWLGTALAAHGIITVAVDHPGNNARESGTAEGAALTWLRAVDLAAAIDAVRSDSTLGAHIDPARIGAAGHSLGGYTVIALAGGITDPARLQTFCGSPAADALCTPSPATTELRRQGVARLATDPDFRERYGKAGASYRDPRIRAVFAMAPGPGPIFTPESLREIAIPIAIVSGSADEIVPSASSAEALGKAIPHATLKLFPHAGHFVFAATCTTAGRVFIPAVCVDPDGADRAAIHAATIDLARAFFDAHLR